MNKAIRLLTAEPAQRPLRIMSEMSEAAEPRDAAAAKRPFSPSKEADLLRLLMPTPATAGFDLCSPRCFQIWHALFYHACQHGKWCCPDALPDEPRYAELKCIRATGLAAFWSIELLANVCDVEPKTAGRVLAELRDLGWIRYCSRSHNEQGQFYGLLYVLTVPPAELTATARHRYKEEIGKQRRKLDTKEKRVDRGVPPCQRLAETEEDVPDPFVFFPRIEKEKPK